MKEKLHVLASELDGELYDDVMMRTLYATDASAYREMPLAVAVPASIEDLKTLIAFANKQQTSLIPRTAGTSLAGQVVGNGIVVDVSKHFTRIIELNVDERWVRVEPGVIRDELNLFLKPHGLFFGPETSTANRAMIGGMVGNNSCGSNSLVYGSGGAPLVSPPGVFRARAGGAHLVSARGFLSGGSEVAFGPLSAAEFAAKCSAPDTLETRIYCFVREL